MDPTLLPRRHAVGQIYQQHYRWLCTRLSYRTGCPDSAEDIAAETFLKVWTLPDPSAIREPRALLTTIAYRLLYERWRRRDLEHAHLQHLAGVPQALHPSPQEQLILIESLLAIERRLDVSGHAKAVFVHRQLDGMTYAQISARLGLSLGRIHQLMTLALHCCHRGLGFTFKEEGQCLPPSAPMRLSRN